MCRQEELWKQLSLLFLRQFAIFNRYSREALTSATAICPALYIVVELLWWFGVIKRVSSRRGEQQQRETVSLFSLCR